MRTEVLVKADKLPIFRPFGDRTPGKVSIATLGQMKETYNLVDEIIDNLDDLSIKELAGGYENDLEDLLTEISASTFELLYGGTKHLIKDTSIYHMKVLSDRIEQILRISNLNYFITSVLGEFEMNWHHLEWGALVQEYNKLCLIAPRDHGKSYFFSHAYPIWKMYRYSGIQQYLGKTVKDNLNHRGFIISNEMSLAEDLVEIIQNSIEENEILRDKLLPDGKEKWAKQSIRCKNGARLNIKSYGGSFRGRHPGWIVVDDFLKDNVIYSELQRKKAIDYFHSVIMNAIIPGGQTIVVGTPFHAADLYGDLKTKRTNRGWKVFEYPAIRPDGRILWENRYSLDDLLGKKEAQGNIIFSREILCRPIVSDSSIFSWNVLKRALMGMTEYSLAKNIVSFPKQFDRVITACDLALSASVGADYSVFSTWGIDMEKQEMWLLHLWRGKGKTYKEQMAVLKSINRNFRPKMVVVEANQFQRMFADMAREEHGIPVVPHTTTASNKNNLEQGLPSLALMFERGKIKFPYGDQHSKDVADLVMNEFSNVTWTDKGIEGVGEHDDCAMSTWLGYRGMKYNGPGGGWGVAMV